MTLTPSTHFQSLTVVSQTLTEGAPTPCVVEEEVAGAVLLTVDLVRRGPRPTRDRRRPSTIPVTSPPARREFGDGLHRATPRFHVCSRRPWRPRARSCFTMALADISQRLQSTTATLALIVLHINFPHSLKISNPRSRSGTLFGGPQAHDPSARPFGGRSAGKLSLSDRCKTQSPAPGRTSSASDISMLSEPALSCARGGLKGSRALDLIDRQVARRGAGFRRITDLRSPRPRTAVLPRSLRP